MKSISKDVNITVRGEVPVPVFGAVVAFTVVMSVQMDYDDEHNEYYAKKCKNAWYYIGDSNNVPPSSYQSANINDWWPEIPHKEQLRAFEAAYKAANNEQEPDTHADSVVAYWTKQIKADTVIIIE